MAYTKGIKTRLLLALLLSLGLILSGCATVPPQPISGIQPTVSPTPAPEATNEPDSTDAPNGTDASDAADRPGATDAPEQPADEPANTAPKAVTTPAARSAVLPVQIPGEPPSRVEIFYSGMPSLMGFADASQTTIYEHTMDALPVCVSLSWPNAATAYYRYGADTKKESMALSKEQALAHIGEPYFYLDAPMWKLPERVKAEGVPVTTAAQNMNEPIESFFNTLGIVAPSSLGGVTGTPVAVRAIDPDTLTLIVTDLHELRIDDGTLLDSLNEHCLNAGLSIGVVAVMSEFSGLIPGIGANDTSFVWGAPPTGSLDYLLEYSAYTLGVSVDPAQRALAKRPFYILCIGEQNAVNTYLSALSERLTREFSGNETFALRTAVYGGGYVPHGYAMGGNMRYVAGQGVTAIADSSAPGGVNLIELKASQQERFLEWEIDYTVHPADPRGMNMTADDFTFFVTARTDVGDTVLPHLNWRVSGVSGDTVTLRLRLDLPAGILPAGSYTLELLGSLIAPNEMPGSDWLDAFGYDADGSRLYDMEQNAAPFEGGRTLFLSRLIDSLGKANQGRLGVAPLGAVNITLTVYA